MTTFASFGKAQLEVRNGLRSCSLYCASNLIIIGKSLNDYFQFHFHCPKLSSFVCLSFMSMPSWYGMPCCSWSVVVDTSKGRTALYTLRDINAASTDTAANQPRLKPDKPPRCPPSTAPPNSRVPVTIVS